MLGFTIDNMCCVAVTHVEGTRAVNHLVTKEYMVHDGDAAAFVQALKDGERHSLVEISVRSYRTARLCDIDIIEPETKKPDHTVYRAASSHDISPSEKLYHLGG